MIEEVTAPFLDFGNVETGTLKKPLRWFPRDLVPKVQ